MTYKLRYSRQFQINYSEMAKVELEEEFHESIAPCDALRSLQSEVDKMSSQLIEKNEVRGEELKVINGRFVQADRFALWQACSQAGN